MEITKDKWIYGMWSIGNAAGDWLGSLWREADGTIIFEYRFRYYKDGKAFDSQDVKNWYTAKMPPGTPIEKAIAAVQLLLPVIERQYGSKVDFVDLQCQGDDPKIMFEIGSRPWANVKQIPKSDPDYEKYAPKQ